MTPADKLAEIKARLSDRYTAEGYDDIPWLIARVERLTEAMKNIHNALLKHGDCCDPEDRENLIQRSFERARLALEDDHE